MEEFLHHTIVMPEEMEHLFKDLDASQLSEDGFHPTPFCWSRCFLQDLWAMLLCLAAILKKGHLPNVSERVATLIDLFTESDSQAKKER